MPRLHYTGLHRSVAIFIPDSAAVSLRHSNPVRDAEQKSLRFGGDMKSNPVCAEQCKQANPVRFGTKSFSVLACMF